MKVSRLLTIADGYTVIAATTAASTVAVHLQKNPGFDVLKDYEFVAPKGTPGPILKKLEMVVAQTVSRPEVKKALEIQATEIVIAGPVEFRKIVADSMDKNAKLVKSLGLTAN